MNYCCWIFVFFTMSLWSQESLKLHVPSPDWQDQVIYFIMIDRFNDGDPTNNDQGMGEYGPIDSRKFNGGDLQGIIDKLDYIKNLGATTIWITPPVANQWWDPLITYGGYHGYWAQDFKAVDPHFGDLETYQQLSDALHRNDMYLIQDIVVNHTGNYFEYIGGYKPENITAFFTENLAAVPTNRPTQYPFNLNDPHNPEHRQAAIYHWTPMISRYDDLHQRITYQLSGLDDLNTANPQVRKALRDAFGYWIKTVGVDGYRVDTVIYVELDYWHDFVLSEDAEAPGINRVAEESGRKNFLSFGEAMLSADPLDDGGDREVAAYTGTAEAPGLSSVLQFPLYNSMKRVFSQGKPTRYLSYRMQTMMNRDIYRNPYLLPTFVDNHDTQRFINTARLSALKQALFFIMTTPGIPVIYQGTEQLFEKQRETLFAGGYGSNGKARFFQDSEMYLFLQKLAKLRTGNKVFTRGDVKILQDSPVGAGVLAFQRMYEAEKVIVVFNTADQPVLMSNLETGLPAGTKLEKLAGFGIEGDWIAGAKGKVTRALPGRSAAAFRVSDKEGKVTKSGLFLDVDKSNADKTFSADFTVRGVVSNPVGLKLVIDGKLNSAVDVEVGRDGLWKAPVDISQFPFGESEHVLTIYSPEEKVVSSSIPFKTKVALQGASFSIDDPVEDDHGPDGSYLIPQDVTFAGQMDITKVDVTAFGGNLLINITTRDFSDVWLPPNGFDHVVFHIFIDVPGQEGKKRLPKLNADAPEGFAWDYVSYTGGWTNSLYSQENATDQHFGEIAIPTPLVSVDKAAKKIRFQFTPDALGNPKTLAGGKIYITTWDGGGGEGFHRSISKAGAAFEFGGSDDSAAPLILDDTDVIVIPE